MTMYPARVTELPNPAMEPPAITIRPRPEPLPEPSSAPRRPEDSDGADRNPPGAEGREGRAHTA